MRTQSRALDKENLTLKRDESQRERGIFEAFAMRDEP